MRASRATGTETAVQWFRVTVDLVRKITFSAKNAIWSGLLFHLFGAIVSVLQALCGFHIYLI